MDLEELRTFLAAVRHGNLSQAARELSVSQPGISRRIHKLERELGAKLLKRAHGTLTPTREGLHFLRFARRVLDEYGSLLAALQEEGQVRGKLRIAASTTPGEHLLPDLLARFLRIYPEVKASLHVMDSASVEEGVAGERFDVGFSGRPASSPRLAQLVAGEDEIVVAAPKTHPLAGMGEVPLERLKREAFVVRHEGSGTRLSVERLLERQGVAFPALRGIMEVSSVHSQIEAIAAGHGLGFVSRYAIRAHAPGSVAVLRIAGLELRRSLYMLYLSDRSDRALSALVDYVREHGIA